MSGDLLPSQVYENLFRGVAMRAQGHSFSVWGNGNAPKLVTRNGQGVGE